jgi:2-dehydro-3-deoxyphosphogluconate aldolase/(4S)-4-hydroxy-2-oxoglutarate aldolase
MSSVTEGTRRTIELLADCTVVPVITIERAEDAIPLARALVAGGVRAIEITLRTPAARQAAANVITQAPEAIVGIGTVLSPDDLADAHRLGARFVVSPGSTPELLSAAARSDLPFLPGVQTASELMSCLAHGFGVVKFFPAVPAGGIAALRALAGPFPDAMFCPTGGVGEANAADWLKEPNVIAVGGSWIAPASDIRNGNWAAITERARRAQTLRQR